MKTKIIEIIGPPGVGKSTIYQSLCKTWKPGAQWVYPDVVLTAKPGFFSLKKRLVFNLSLLLGKKLTKTIPVDYGLRFAGQQQDLANFCWNYIADIQFFDDRDINKRFRSAYFLFRTFCTYQAILEKAPAKPCIIQEGFLQKSFFIRDKEEDDQMIDELLNNYLRLIPLPHTIIYIDTPDSKEIVKRLRGRSKIIVSHYGKDDTALQLDVEKWRHAQNKMLEKLKSAGVLVVQINGMAPVKENVSIIKELLKKIADAREAGPAMPVDGSIPNPLEIPAVQ
jgi:deoxyadenosine/deoxycytidine kinase